MWDRLNIMGAGGRWLNGYSAMRLGGFTNPEELCRAIECGEFQCNQKMLVDGDPRNSRSMIRIEAGSYIRWLERRRHLPLQETKAKIEDITWRLGMLQTEIGQIQQQINRLVTLFEKQNSPVVRRQGRRLKKLPG